MTSLNTSGHGHEDKDTMDHFKPGELVPEIEGDVWGGCSARLSFTSAILHSRQYYFYIFPRLLA
jgi:hypothetical protein